MPLYLKLGLQVTLFLESGFTSLSMIKLSDGHPLIRVAQNAPKVKNLQGHQSYPCFLPNCWEKCIETPKKLIARGGNRLRHLEPHLPYGYEGKNATFWSSSFFTPLIAWKTQTNIQKHICTSQCPSRDPKSTKIELSDQISRTLKWPRMHEKSIFWDSFSIFPHSLYPMASETCRNKLAH